MNRSSEPSQFPAGIEDDYSNGAIADRLEQTFIATGDRWFNIAAKRLRAPAQPSRDALIALIRSKARVAGHDAWEGGYYHLANPEELADAILALSSAQREPVLPHVDPNLGI